MGRSLPDDLDAAAAWLSRCSRDRDGAYRAVRMREIEAKLEHYRFGPLVAEFATLPPAEWEASVRFVYIQSLLEPLRPQLMRFDGRRHDDIVKNFARVEAELRSISRDRVMRAACRHLVEVSNEHAVEATTVAIELQKKRPRKPLRTLYAEAPNMMLALAPCVMASPLSISQFLPRASIFDVVIFDEGSQVTPEAAVTAILRGKRVVIAGDERQLPPTDFFKGAIDDDNDGDDDIAITGTESILAAMRPFAKELDLRVHYRSRNERLIAFSNHYLYGDALITFPGTGGDGKALRFEYVDPSGSEIDEDSSGPEVRRVVDLIVEHAEQRPSESLGVIALGSPHANRIETLLAATRRDRPDLDSFFSGESGPEPFFVKNLERVQGDERDAIILTIGYGRTKTGAVSHNFGPVNQDGGERRINVAVTRAKSRLTLVSTIRKGDLNPNALVKTGSKLLATYLGYVESSGNDLGRDGADLSVPPNAFEADIQQALERRLGTSIIPQYGVGKFRIDLAVQHPTEQGRFIMAVECDGASYHSAPSARLRDRLRQTVLEGLGWHFCRVWSTDWFNNREPELDRIEAAYKLALTRDSEDCVAKPTSVPLTATTPERATIVDTRTTPSPVRPPYRSIDDLSDRTLRDLSDWIASDGRLRTDDELIGEMVRELGFQRRGVRIVERLERIIRRRRS
jgi:very-short-patch-repair endonuclease